MVLYESDGDLVKDGSIDERLRNARRIIILGTTKDKGAVKIDLTSRTIEAYQESEDVTRALAAFKRQLLEEARSVWFTAGGAAGLFFIPLLAIVADGFIDALVNPMIRHDWIGRPPGKGFYPGPDAIALTIAAALGFIAIVTTLSAVTIGIVVTRSGPLRIWPDVFTAESFQQVGYRLRSSMAKNSATIVVGVFCAVVGAIVTALLTR